MTGATGLVSLGVIGRPHGVRGAFRIKTFTEVPESISAYGPLRLKDGTCLTLKILRVLKGDLVIASAPEITSPEQVKALTGEELLIDRSQLPPTEDEEFYIDDLIGLRAETLDGAPAGNVVAVHDFGAGDLIELAKIPGVNGPRLVRFTKALVPTIDISGGKIVIDASALDLGIGDPEPATDQDQDSPA